MLRQMFDSRHALQIFLEGKTLTELTKARLVSADGNEGTGMVRILLEGPEGQAVMNLYPLGVDSIAQSFREALLVKVPNEALDVALEPFPLSADTPITDLDRGNAFLIQADKEAIHWWIQARVLPLVVRCDFNTVEARRFEAELRAARNTLTPGAVNKNLVREKRTGFEDY